MGWQLAPKPLSTEAVVRLNGRRFWAPAADLLLHCQLEAVPPRQGNGEGTLGGGSSPEQGRRRSGKGEPASLIVVASWEATSESKQASEQEGRGVEGEEAENVVEFLTDLAPAPVEVVVPLAADERKSGR
ncbi:hypothetical protein SETIT_5G190600v2 [Setaria italica]|uniref:Uncharacterized protein n=1 Tax=Setaria italica TaxID=4555 RepID=A0A368R853_SETIT|nr:hypothetical protein SETIT_5G190600v2 [Setaria italica]